MEESQKHFFRPLFTIILGTRNTKISPIFHFDRGNNGRNCHILCVNGFNENLRGEIGYSRQVIFFNEHIFFTMNQVSCHRKKNHIRKSKICTIFIPFTFEYKMSWKVDDCTEKKSPVICQASTRHIFYGSLAWLLGHGGKRKLCLKVKAEITLGFWFWSG